MASKRKQNDVFSRLSQSRPVSSADSLFSSTALSQAASKAQGSASPSLNNTHATVGPSRTWQNGDQATQVSLNDDFDYGYLSPTGGFSDTNYHTDFSQYEGSSAAGEDMSDFDDLLNLDGPHESRASSEKPPSYGSFPSHGSQSYLPGQTVSPRDIQRTPSTSSPAHLLSPAMTNTSSPRPLLVSTQSPLCKPVAPQTSGWTIPPTSLHRSEIDSGLKEASWAGTLSNGSSSHNSQSGLRQKRPSPRRSSIEALRSGPSEDTTSVTDAGLEQAPVRQGFTPGQRAQLNETEIPTLEEEEKQREVTATNDSVKQWLSGTTIKAPKNPPVISYASNSNVNTAPATKQATVGALVEEEELEESDEDDDWEKRTSLAEDSPPTPRASHDHVLQTMAEATDADPSSLDVRLRRVNLWTDSPNDDDAASMKHAPESSTGAIERFARRAREVETVSMAATYAPSRRTSRADTESLFSSTGISQRKPSYATEDWPSFDEALEPAPEPPKHNNIFNKMQRKFSKGTNRRRKESQETETGRPSLDTSKRDSQNSIPSIKKTSSSGQPPSQSHHDSSSKPSLAASTVGSFNLSQMKPLFGRNRSRSDLGGDRRNSALAQQWAASGGPPVAFVRPSQEEVAQYEEQASLAAPVEQDPGPQPDVPHLNTHGSTMIGHEIGEDEDEVVTPTTATAGPARSIEIPATATLEGFRDHARKVSPKLTPFLLERIAQEQVKRYRILVDLRIEHHQHVINNTCESGQRCADLGTGPKYLRPLKARADKDEKSSIFQISAETPFHEIEHLNFEETPQLATFPDGIPPPPVKQFPAEFECPICFKIKRLQKPSDWSKHCFEDLYPFICSFGDCSEPKSFNRKADWSRHESERHLKLETWTCCYADCTHVCHRRDNFIQHLVRAHKMVEPKGQGARRKTAEDESEVSKLAKECHRDTPKRPEEQGCPFCGNFCNAWKKLAVHLANHMKQINLPLLALIEKEDISRYIQPENGTGLDTVALMHWRRKASLAQNYPVPVGTPSFGESMSPQPSAQQLPMDEYMNGAIIGNNGQTMVHPAFQQGAHTFPGTKNLQKQPSPFNGSVMSNQSMNDSQFGRDFDPRQLTYLDAIEHIRSGQRTPTPSTYSPPYASNGHLAVESNLSFYPATTAYGNDAMYTTSPTFDDSSGSRNGFSRVMPNGMPADVSDPTQYYNSTTMKTATMSQHNMIHNNMSRSVGGHQSNHSMNGNMDSNISTPMSNEDSGFMPSQSGAARNAQLNARFILQQNANAQYRDQRNQQQQTMYYDANDFNGNDQYSPLDLSSSAPQFPTNGMSYQQQTMPGQQNYQQQSHGYGQEWAAKYGR